MAEKLCKHCATAIPMAAKVCPHCRRRQGMSFITGCLLVIMIGFGVMFVITIIGIAVNGYHRTRALKNPTAALEEGFYLDASEERLIVADSERALDEWIRAGIKNNYQEQIALITTEHIMVPARFSRVSIKHMGPFKTEMEFLDGNYVGRSGWALTNQIKKGIPK